MRKNATKAELRYKPGTRELLSIIKAFVVFGAPIGLALILALTSTLPVADQSVVDAIGYVGVAFGQNTDP